MFLSSTALALLLGFGPPGDEPPVQMPTGPREDGADPGAEAEVGPGGRADPVTGSSSDAETDSVLEPASGIPTAGAGQEGSVPAAAPSPFDPSAPVPAPGTPPDPIGSDPSPARFDLDSALLDVPGYERPPGRGIAAFSVGAGLGGLAITKQVLLIPFCEDPACNQPQVFDRLVLAGGVISASIGGYMHGQTLAHEDALAGRRARDTTPYKVGGFLLMGVGLAGYVLDNVFSAVCFTTASGPYFSLVDGSPFVGTCRPGLSAATMDVSAVMAGFGGALGLYGLGYDRWRPRYDKALKSLALPPVTVAPMGTPGGGYGLSLSGRF